MGDWALLALGLVPPLVFFLVQPRPLRLAAGVRYALATLPQWLENQRQLGLFALAHVPMNIDYLFLKLPAFTSEFPYFRPDGLGMSVFFTSPGLLLAARAPWRDARSWILLLAAVLVLIPTLLYYGGGWLQYGSATSWTPSRSSGRWWRWGSSPRRDAVVGLDAILWGVLIGLGGVYWAYHL